MVNLHTYRNRIKSDKLKPFKVIVKETDLFIYAKTHLKSLATELVLRYRGYIETYIKKQPDFITSLSPWHETGPAPNIVKDMINAGNHAGIGPMASVAGAIAEYVGKNLLSSSDEIIVENGGDVFIKTNSPVVVGIFAGGSPLSLNVGMRIDSSKESVSVCTSSGTVGHSLSMGTADAVCVKSGSCALADAAATSIGNRVKKKSDIENAISYGKTIKGVDGIVIIRKQAMGIWGDIEVTGLGGKKT